MKADVKRTLQAVLWGGAAAGTADIISAIGGRGGKAVLVLQYIASGLIGPTAVQGGWLTAAAGLAVHFGLTTIMAALFVLAARRRPVLWQNPWPAGFVYGALLFVIMVYGIVPHLSAAPGWKTPGGFWNNFNGAMMHGFLVGVPIACVARYFLGGRPEAQILSTGPH